MNKEDNIAWAFMGWAFGGAISAGIFFILGYWFIIATVLTVAFCGSICIKILDESVAYDKKKKVEVIKW